MKRLLYVLLALVLISVNLFSYLFVSNKYALDFLYNDKQMIRIDFGKAESSFEEREFIHALIQFSKENQINISQYYFMDDTDVNIYSTNIMDDPNIVLKSGDLPKGNEYLSSKKEEEDSRNEYAATQSGVASFPLSSWNFRIYDIQQFNNVGLRDEFFISGDISTNLEQAFIEQFKRYGEVSFVNQKISSLVLINMTLLMLVIFSFVIFGLALFYFAIKKRKSILLRELWGYSYWKVCFYLPSLFMRFLILAVCLLLLGILLFVAIFDQFYFLGRYLTVFVASNGTALLVILLLMLIGSWIVLGPKTASGSIKGKVPFGKVQWISAILKTIVSGVLFSIVCSSFANLAYLSSKLESISYWNKTKNVYRIQVGPVRDDVRTNLVLDREFNDRLFDFYKKIEAKHKAFLMVSENYNVIGYDQDQPVYFYTLNTTGDEEIYSPNGRSVIINKNYLDINPIYTSNGISIEEQLIDDADTLNLLVPEQYAQWEQEIISEHKQKFYFRKVQIKNMYNEALGQALNEQKLEDLKINIIYTRQGQDYFTFNSYTGDRQNNITDPIAQIYNDSVDTSNIGAYVTSSLYFTDDSQGSAFERIYPSIIESGAYEINNTISIYNEANEQIIQLQWLLFNQIIALIITVIFSIVLLISFIWSYYEAKIYRLTIKKLFGYSYWKINKEMIVTMLATYAFSGLLVYLIYKMLIVVLAAFCTIIIDLLLMVRLSSHLHRKNVNKVLKGEHL